MTLLHLPGVNGVFSRFRKPTAPPRKRDLKNEDCSHNVIENKWQVFHRGLPSHNLQENKWVTLKSHNVYENKMDRQELDLERTL